MNFLNDERYALSDFIGSFDQSGFEAFLVRAGGHRLSDFSAVVNPMPVVAVHFMAWLEQKPQHIVGILRTALSEFPLHESAACMEAALDRLRHVKARQAGTAPWTAKLINGIPMANRAPLRDWLRRIASDTGPDVVMIHGLEGSGRSHSWYLIHYVARHIRHVVPVKIDVTAPILEKRTVENVFELLVRKLNLSAVMPTTSGATVETIAARFADEIATAISKTPQTNPIWMVFDSIDRPVPPEIKKLICNLVELRLAGEMHNCKMFLLGADQDFGVEDQYRLVETEHLSRFLTEEVRDAAMAINSLGVRPLSSTQLNDWLTPVIGELCLFSVRQARQAGEHISQKLVELRMEVGA
jgi:hypothetical protein